MQARSASLGALERGSARPFRSCGGASSDVLWASGRQIVGEERQVVGDGVDWRALIGLKQQLARLALRSGIPAVVVGTWRKGADQSAEALLKLVGKTIKEAGPTGTSELRAKAAMGDRYIVELRSQAEAAYALAHRDPKVEGKGVNIDTFRKSVLDKIGDDVDALLSVITENRSLAKQRFPGAVLRSSIPTAPEDQEAAPEVKEHGGESKVDRLHS